MEIEITLEKKFIDNWNDELKDAKTPAERDRVNLKYTHLVENRLNAEIYRTLGVL